MYRSAISKLAEEMQRAVERDIDVAAWWRKFAGADKDNLTFFDSFPFPGVVKAAFYQISGR
jgi:hypothetical protein